jgi:hypothetical protein
MLTPRNRVHLGSINSSRDFFATPKVAASAVQCQSVTAKRDLDTVEVAHPRVYEGLRGFLVSALTRRDSLTTFLLQTQKCGPERGARP